MLNAGVKLRARMLLCFARVMTAVGPSVWTGRALQAENDDLERLVLRFCIRPIDGAF